MDNTISISNPGPNVKYVGPCMILPGETRVFNLQDLPPGYVVDDAPAIEVSTPIMSPPEPDVFDLAEMTVDVVVGKLPELADDELQQLEKIEESKGKGKARKTVLEAINKEQVERANDKILADELKNKSDEELLDLQAGMTEGSRERGLVDAELEHRTIAALEQPQ